MHFLRAERRLSNAVKFLVLPSDDNEGRVRLLKLKMHPGGLHIIIPICFIVLSCLETLFESNQGK